MEPLANPIRLSAPFLFEQPTHNPSVASLLRCEAASSSEVGGLHVAHASKGYRQRARFPAVRGDAVERLLVRVQGDGRSWFVGPTRLLAHNKEDFSWDKSERPQSPGRIVKEGSMPLREGEVQL